MRNSKRELRGEVLLRCKSTLCQDQKPSLYLRNSHSQSMERCAERIRKTLPQKVAHTGSTPQRCRGRVMVIMLRNDA